MRLVTFAGTYLDWFGNLIYSASRGPYSTLYYIVESRDWSTKWDGRYITKNLNRQGLVKAKTATTYWGIRNQIIHLGSRNLFLPDVWREIDASNKIIFTWFHGTEEGGSPLELAMIRDLPEASKKADIVHTSCAISKENLIKWGVPKDKIVVIPLGVDLALFQAVPLEEKKKIREHLGIPQNKIVIGSFQKDGTGWGEGFEPKWVKGPDIFIRAIDKLSRQYDIFVLLTGPARGYIKRELDKIDVPYKHYYLNNYLEIPRYYNALDLYLVASRAEGGPKAILESMAAGVPLVSTRVGMAPDTIIEGDNGFLAEVDNVEELANKAGKIIEDRTSTRTVVENALNTVKDYAWEKIARKYYERIYSNFLGE